MHHGIRPLPVVLVSEFSGYLKYLLIAGSMCKKKSSILAALHKMSTGIKRQAYLDILSYVSTACLIIASPIFLQSIWSLKQSKSLTNRTPGVPISKVKKIRVAFIR